jgi:outer membrane protein assembly factor BamE (lipoprotein component of BamABCDE complex)
MASLRSLAALAAILLLISGCAAVGKNIEYQSFDAGKLENVTPGRTTAGQVATLFGAPTQVVELSGGNAYVYERSVSKATGAYFVLISFVRYDQQYDRLVFFFNEDNVLTHYGFSLKADTSAYGLPF